MKRIYKSISIILTLVLIIAPLAINQVGVKAEEQAITYVIIHM